MGIFRRMSDLLTANLNDLIDRCEDPEVMLKQAIREMESALRTTLDSAARAIAQRRLLTRQRDDHRREIEHSWQQAEAALRRSDDDAARAALRRKAEHDRLAAALDQEIARAATLSERLRGQIALMRSRLAEARRRLLDVTVRQQMAGSRRQFTDALRSPACDDSAFAHFDRLCSRVAQSDAETEALLELLNETDDVPADDPLEATVEDELRALKEKTNHAAL